MLPRFFAPDAGRSAAGATVPLPEDESAHARRVLRLGPGANVRVFDGEGREWRAEIAEVAKARVQVTLLEAVVPAREPRVPMTLAVAMLKGDKMDDVVRDAVMLGAAVIQPLFTGRTEVTPSVVKKGHRIERWQRIAVASCKQCGRAVVPPVRAPQELTAWLGQPPQGARLFFAEPDASAAVPVRRVHDLPAPSSAELIVGPEGGWTDGEVEAARAAGAELVSLGPMTLRADAVPLVALTALRTVWRDL